MKILLNSGLPFALAHGGVQVQIEQTKSALEELGVEVGVEVEYLRWWDQNQHADIIHNVGRASSFMARMAHEKGIKIISAELMGGLGARKPFQHKIHRAAINATRKFLPPMVETKMEWDIFRIADAFITLTPWEAHLTTHLFGAPADRVHVVPNGVENVFFGISPEPRSEWLVCTSTIRDIKRPLELARAAVQAQTPLWIIGRPYAEADPYYTAFLEFSKQHKEFIRYEGPIADRVELARIYRAARGFVLLSAYESLSLSALEAAACECPLLLSDLPWARSSFAETASYCPVAGTQVTANKLRAFYDKAPTLPPPPKPLTWLQVGEQLRDIYQSLLTA